MKSKVKLVLCTIMSLFVLINLNVKTFAQDIDKYITENKKEYMINDTAAILNVFSKEVLDSTKLFIVGENHDVYFNDSIEFSLFKNLYYHANVRFIIIERPFSISYFLRKSFETGNDSIIEEVCRKLTSENNDNIFRQLPDSVIYKLMGVDRYIVYRDFYLSLPDSAKFKLIGVDFEPCTWFTVYFLKDIYNSLDIPDEIYDVVNMINVFYNSEELPSTLQLVNFIALTRESLAQHDILYRQLLNEKYSLFIGVIG